MQILNNIGELNNYSNYILYFTAKWCGPCKLTSSKFNNLAIYYKDNNSIYSKIYQLPDFNANTWYNLIFSYLEMPPFAK